MTSSPTMAPARDPRAEKVRRFRELYLAGRLDEVLFGDDANWDNLAEAVFGQPAPALSLVGRDDR